MFTYLVSICVNVYISKCIHTLFIAKDRALGIVGVHNPIVCKNKKNVVDVVFLFAIAKFASVHIYFLSQQVIVIVCKRQGKTLFIIYFYRLYRKCRENSDIESRVILQSVTKFNEQYALNQMQSITSHVNVVEEKHMYCITTAKEDGEIYFLIQENGSQFVLGYNLIKVTICTQAPHILVKKRVELRNFPIREMRILFHLE